jgi:hypothetical protein
MLSEIWKNLQSILKPYSLEDFIKDHNPQTHQEVEYLERMWSTQRTKGYWDC